uniref:Flagellar FliJ protein n=1 Tax=Heterorhabditis bacteriophora TaxID=37862 RepID=A0A1I7WC37_HETBA
METRFNSLKNDLNRMAVIEKSVFSVLQPNLLIKLDNPSDYEIETAEDFRSKIVHVRTMMNELVIRTSLNEQAAHREMEEQEREFAIQVSDAIRARNLLRTALLESQNKTEQEMIKRKLAYEALYSTEKRAVHYEAVTWLILSKKSS